MSPKDIRSVLDSWAVWIQDGRPLPFNCYPPANIICRWGEEHTPTYGSRPLWHGRLRSYWIKEVDRALQSLPEQRQAVLLGLHLPGKATDTARAKDMGITLSQAAYTRRLAHRALERL